MVNEPAPPGLHPFRWLRQGSKHKAANPKGRHKATKNKGWNKATRHKGLKSKSAYFRQKPKNSKAKNKPFARPNGTSSAGAA